MGAKIDKHVKGMIETLSPEQRGVVEAAVRLRVENRQLRAQVDALKQQHDDLWKILTVILSIAEGNELRIHRSQFLRFKEEYRIDRSFDDDANEYVFKLKTLKD